jgi:ribokinase
MTNAELTVVGSSLVDLMAYSDKLPVAGETVKGWGFQMTAGGKGANQAAAAARLGVSTLLLGKMSGSDRLTEVLKEGLSWAGVDLGGVEYVSGVTCGVGVVMVGGDSQNQITIVAGPNELLAPADVDRLFDRIAASRIMMTEFGIPVKTAEHATLAARKAGVLTVVTPGPASPMSDEFYAAVDVLVPNETEAFTLTGIGVTDDNSSMRAARFFHAKGVRNVIVTLGKEGAYVSDGTRGEHLPAVAVDAVDATGAGDAFNGGLARGLLDGRDIFGAARFAAVVAALSVTKKGTMRSMPSLEEVREFMRLRGDTP